MFWRFPGQRYTLHYIIHSWHRLDLLSYYSYYISDWLPPRSFEAGLLCTVLSLLWLTRGVTLKYLASSMITCALRI